jgi:hypothetical protein
MRSSLGRRPPSERLSARSELAEALRYIIKRPTVLTRFATDARLEANNNIAKNPVGGSRGLRPTHTSLGEKDCQPGALHFIFYRLGVHWCMPENRVDHESADPQLQLGLAGHDLAHECEHESLD